MIRLISGQQRSGLPGAVVWPCKWAMLLGAMFCITTPVRGQACTEVVPKLTASDGALLDDFGISVAIDGETAIVGAHADDDQDFESGSAYVFVRSPASGAWTQQQKLTAFDGQLDDRFGVSVAINSDTAIVGAHGDDDLGASSGSAYVFVRSATTNRWTQQQKLHASDGAALNYFGASVSISGDTAIVGAWGKPNPDFVGAAYVFIRSPTNGVWTQQQILTASDGAAGDDFGWSVAINGDTAIVGARGDDDLGNESGSAYVFARSGNVWTQQQKLIAFDGAVSDLFGWSVSISGETALVGALAGDGVVSESGSAYVFVRTGTVWTQMQELTASDGDSWDWFGVTVGISDDTAIVGAAHDADLRTNRGSAYVFVRSGEAWNQQLPKLTASDGAQSDQFGYSVAISGERAIVGAFGDNHLGTNSGSAYVFECNRSCEGDIAPAPAGNQAVDVDDLLAVITGWGPCPTPPATCPANIVTSGASVDRVDVDDLLAVITNWGPCRL